MKLMLKLALRNLLTYWKRTVFTLFCVIFSVSLIGIVVSISESLLRNVRFDEDSNNKSAVVLLCAGFVFAVCFMACFAVYTAFSISMWERIKSFGFFGSLGMSDSQKTLLVLTEAAIYGIVGVFFGIALGFGISSVFYNAISDAVFKQEGAMIGRFTASAFSVSLSFFLGLSTVLIASFFPLHRVKRLSILETIKDNNQINISLKQSFFSCLVEKHFGRIGLLAGQNYDNNKRKYRAVSFALSGGTILFITVYCFFRYAIWYELQQGRPYVRNIWSYLSYSSSVLMVLFVLVFLFCAIGSARQNMQQRNKELAIYKSMGMQNSELYKMMSLEVLFLVWHSVLFGFLGSLIGDYAVCIFYRLQGVDDLKFHYPFGVFCLFVVLNVVVGLLFALYSRYKVGKVNIAEAMRGN